VPYFLSATFPDDVVIIAAAEDTLTQWNEVGREAVTALQGRAPSDDVFVLCHSPVRADDHEVCGAEGFVPRLGDLRYSTLHWVEARHRTRGRDSDEAIARRLGESALEMSHWQDFDYVVVNRDFERALADLEAIFDGRGEASRRDRPELPALARDLLGT
jgi:hypothetical protein